MSTNRRRTVGRNWLERRLHWLYFWLDLYGSDGKPSHSKVMTVQGFYFALVFESVMGVRMAWTGTQPEMAFTTLVLGTLSLAMGRSVFSRFMGLKEQREADG